MFKLLIVCLWREYWQVIFTSMLTPVMINLVPGEGSVTLIWVEVGGTFVLPWFINNHLCVTIAEPDVML